MEENPFFTNKHVINTFIAPTFGCSRGVVYEALRTPVEKELKQINAELAYRASA